MDEEGFWLIIYMLGLVAVCIAFPFVTIGIVVVCMAYSRTREWQKEKSQRGTLQGFRSEAENLMVKDNASDSDTEDSDEEAERKEKEDKEKDWHLTPREKFRKELWVLWKGKGTAQDRQKAKERVERKKLARAVAKELMKMEQRRNNKKAFTTPREPPDYKTLDQRTKSQQDKAEIVKF